MSDGNSGATGSRRAPLEPATGVDLRPAWRRDDPDIERDAVAFWRRLAILPPDTTAERRSKELAAAAYEGDRLVGVTTIVLSPLEPLRARFAFIRGAVDDAARRRHVGYSLLLYTRDLIERWSADHPEEGVLGLAAVIETPDLAAWQREPVWPITRLNLVGYNEKGRQIRVAWFDHARVE